MISSTARAAWKHAVLFIVIGSISGVADEVYRVRPGDTLSAIAARTHTSVSALQQWNGLRPNQVLRIGQTLRVAPSGPRTGTVTGALVHVRAKPGLTAAIADTAARGTRVTLLGRRGDWWQVRLPNGRHGWIRSDLVAATAPRPVASRHDVPRGAVAVSQALLRVAPDTGADALRPLPRGTSVKLYGRQGSWWKVGLADGASGWVLRSTILTDDADRVKVLPQPRAAEAETAPPTEFELIEAALHEREGESMPLSAAKTAQAKTSAPPPPVEFADGAVVTVRAAGAQLRRGPGARWETIAELPQGTKVTVIRSVNGWLAVETDNGLRGWLGGGETTEGERLLRENPLGGTLVAKAMQYRGLPYRRGGSSPSRGFDCSGLVYRVLQSFGIEAPRTARGQYDIGQPVSRDELQPGDLVFFKNTYRRGISHVGVYIGNGKFIHASTPGRGVIVTSLDDSYYRRKWAGARRIEPRSR